jgi:hypothetical protein
MICRNIIKAPICFGHYCMTIFRGRSLYLVHYHFSACLLRHLPIRYVAVCRLCVSGVPVCGLSHTTHIQVNRTHTHTDTYSHIPNNENEEADKRRSGNALSTEDDP